MTATPETVQALAQLTDRDIAALTEPMDVNPDEPELLDTQVAVYSSHEEDGTMVCERYVADAETGVCDCPDMLHRRPDGGCKHVRRLYYRRGELAVPPSIRDRIDRDLREHIDSGVAADA